MLLYVQLNARWSSWRTDRVTHDVYSKVGGQGLGGVLVCACRWVGGCVGGGGRCRCVVHMRTT